MAFGAAHWPQKRIELRAPIVILCRSPAGSWAGPASSTRGASFIYGVGLRRFEAPLKAARCAPYIEWVVTGDFPLLWV